MTTNRTRPTRTRTPAIHTTEVAPGVFFVEGPAANWVVLADGEGMTLVDTGYRADLPLVRRSLAAVSEKFSGARLHTILVTHAHSDHIGNLAALVTHCAQGTPGTPGTTAAPVQVLASAAELPHIRREVLHQVGIRDVLRRPTPRVLRWAAHAVAAGGMEDVGFAGAGAHPMGVPLDVPGAPVAVATPGHTPGHTAYVLPRHGIVITGDALVTAHPTVRTTGAQLLHPMFNHNTALARAGLSAIAGLDADRFLPGHGPAGTLPLPAALR